MGYDVPGHAWGHSALRSQEAGPGLLRVLSSLSRACPSWRPAWAQLLLGRASAMPGTSLGKLPWHPFYYSFLLQTRCYAFSLSYRLGTHDAGVRRASWPKPVTQPTRERQVTAHLSPPRLSEHLGSQMSLGERNEFPFFHLFLGHCPWCFCSSWPWAQEDQMWCWESNQCWPRALLPLTTSGPRREVPS